MIPCELAVFLIACFPVLDRFPQNADYLQIHQLVRPVIVSWVLCGVLILLFRLWSKDRFVGSLLAFASCLLFWFLDDLVIVSGDPAFQFLPDWFLMGSVMGASLLGLFGCRSLAALIHSRKGLEQRWKFAVLLGSVLCVAPSVMRLVRVCFRTKNPALPRVETPKVQRVPTERPDIYWIVLDAYARGDVLRSIYSYDNTEFLQGLKQRGFYLVEKSQSNYRTTVLSLGASLNLDYLKPPALKPHQSDLLHEPFYRHMEDPALLRLSNGPGYQTKLVQTGVNSVRSDGFDLLRAPGPSEFEHLLLSRTALGVLAPAWQFSWRQKQIIQGFENLPPPASDPPTFTMLPCSIPHAPFLFDADGGIGPDYPFLLHTLKNRFFDRKNPARRFIEGYRDQLQFVNKLTLAALDDIRARTDREALILIQGDHGPWLLRDLEADPALANWERHSILNAARGPPTFLKALGPSDSALITLRKMAKYGLGADLEDLPDVSFEFQSQRRSPYKLSALKTPVSSTPSASQ